MVWLMIAAGKVDGHHVVEIIRRQSKSINTLHYSDGDTMQQAIQSSWAFADNDFHLALVSPEIADVTRQAGD